MFTNFKVIMHMGAPIATTDDIILDSLISAAICKESYSEKYYSGMNDYGTKEEIESMLDDILDKKMRVYCTSKGIGDNREYTSSWSKNFDSANSELIRTKEKGKKRELQRVRTVSGHFKEYHTQIVLKSYKTLTFYVRGDKEKIKRLLENNINFVGKKSSQGYGEILKYEFLDCVEDYSLFDKQGNIMRNIPFAEIMKLEKTLSEENFLKECPIIPPYWRNDHKELCIL
ncbi:hypothetical protein ACTPEW_16140 [Clostridioides difficile]